MLGAILNKLTGRTAQQEAREQEASKRRALSKYAVYGSEEYELRSEAYDDDALRSRDASGYHKNNLYGQ